MQTVRRLPSWMQNRSSKPSYHGMFRSHVFTMNYYTHSESLTNISFLYYMYRYPQRFFAQSKYASFQRQLNLYGFSRASVPSIIDGKTKNISYYSHPYFIRGDHSRVQYMVRCKVKGTGRKRWREHDEDDTYHDNEDCHQNLIGGPHPLEGYHHHQARESVSTTTHRTFMSDAWVDDPDDSPSLDSSSVAPCELRDGDLLYFDGIPFHFLNPSLDVATLNDSSSSSSVPPPPPDTTTSTNDLEPLPLLSLPPTFPALESELDLLSPPPYHAMEDTFSMTNHYHNNNVPSYRVVPRRYSRSVILDETYDRYRGLSEYTEQSIAPFDRPRHVDSSIMSLLDLPSYDTHSSSTMLMRYGYNRDLSTTTARKHPTFLSTNSNPNETLLDSWSNSRYKNSRVTSNYINHRAFEV